jgi:hypothetical protein
VWRVYLVSRKWWLTIIPATGAIVRTVAAILVTVYTIKLGYLPAFREDHGYLVYISTISSASADLWNTVALCWFLRSRSTVHSRNVINRIMIWVIGVLKICAASSTRLTDHEYAPCRNRIDHKCCSNSTVHLCMYPI